MEKENKNILIGASAALLSFAGAMWIKNKVPLSPKIPVVDESTVLLFQRGYSPFCVKVAKYFDYKGIPYRTVNVIPVLHKKFVKNYSGQELIPFIKYKGRILHDSTSIIKYFEEVKPEPSLLFKDDAELYKDILILEDWADEAFVPPFTKLALIYMHEHPEVIAESDDYNMGLSLMDNNKERIAPFITKMQLDKYGVSLSDKDSLKKKVRAHLDLLSHKLEDKEYLVGDKLTLADITVASHLTVAQRIPYIYEDDLYSDIFNWQKKIFNASKRRLTAISK